MEVTNNFSMGGRAISTIALLYFFSCSQPAGAEEFPELNAKLAMCEGTYAYAIQYFQISGQVGRTKPADAILKCLGCISLD